ncbi:MAG: hypothetical protein GY940_44165 [bacterium]|nr:hypothetical protein [bacterium]
MSRPKVVEISVKIELPNKKKKTIKVDPSSVAIFFNEFSVENILTPFYENEKKQKNATHKLKRTDSEKAFGNQITNDIFNNFPAVAGGNEVEITPELVKKVWNYKDKDGLCPAYLSKMPGCYFGYLP